jgi:Curli production assembly/transport component CsgG
MLLKKVLFPLLLLTCCCVHGQSGKRIAILQANDQFQPSEGRVTDSITAKLAGKPGLMVIDRASIDKLLKEQNFQNSDRSSPETAVRIGKILGAGQIVMVQVYDAKFTTHTDKSGSTTTNTGTVVLQANARTIDVESAVILGQPSSSFQQSAVLGETSTSQGFQFGQIRVPPKQTAKGSDPQVVQDNLWTAAVESVSTDLATKLTATLGDAPGPKAETALVAGIANGSVYINQGTGSGIKAGDRFQVSRMASVGLKDPKTQKDIVQKQKVCTLVIVNADETNSSGTCTGGTPQSGDVAEPIQK